MNLNAWLEYIQSIHPKEIELGLDRVSAVARRLGIARPAPLVVTVAGTNGKGSCIACMDAICRAAGYRSACYTSPHIQHFTERLTVSGERESDEIWCQAFAIIERARGEYSLSYFEYTTLAALLIMQQQVLDIALLEVGLGGRLDAVNIIDADIAIVSSIDLDHTEWLGDSRELIALEKIAIARPGRALVCGDRSPPASIATGASKIGAKLVSIGSDYDFTQIDSTHWHWRGEDKKGNKLEFLALPRPGIDLVNAATALQTLQLLPLKISQSAIRSTLQALKVPGRFEIVAMKDCAAKVIFDVAHNPAAARMLASKLQDIRQQQPQSRIIAVVAMLADKDIKGFCLALESTVDIWYIAQLQLPRALSLEQAALRLQGDSTKSASPAFYRAFDNVVSAFQEAKQKSLKIDYILITGSFFTVAEVRNLIG